MRLSCLQPTSLQPQRSLPRYGAWCPVGYLPKRPLPLWVFLLDRQHSSVRISYITSCDQSSKLCYHIAQFLPVRRKSEPPSPWSGEAGVVGCSPCLQPSCPLPSKPHANTLTALTSIRPRPPGRKHVYMFHLWVQGLGVTV